ncbi:GHMP kinase [Paraburkholderia sp. J67]|uniref:GHMP family kinase ATP-binding protein n=1 Tax=Paraburkholderia sp. J67 TaxID=2805435 RepID=UPI002ABE1FD6|nr:GHMP kinase [Paraburkholderia sp. J67]
MDTASLQQDSLRQPDCATRTRGECPGTFGELLQGVLPDNRHFLVTLPIAARSVVEFEPAPTDRITASIGHKTKSCRAVQDFLRIFGMPPGGVLHFMSGLPVGKGLASSSSDMVAAIRAAAKHYRLEAAPEIIELILRFIEPTDGVMYDGIVSFFHREVMLDEKIGPAPRFTIVSADRGGECNTLQFNRIRRETPPVVQQEYAELLERLKTAVRAHDMRSIGVIATRSCELSQTANPHPHLGVMQKLCADLGALGLVATHSGTCLGLLLDANTKRAEREAAQQASIALDRLAWHGIETRQFTTA